MVKLLRQRGHDRQCCLSSYEIQCLTLRLAEIRRSTGSLSDWVARVAICGRLEASLRRRDRKRLGGGASKMLALTTTTLLHIHTRTLSWTETKHELQELDRLMFALIRAFTAAATLCRFWFPNPGCCFLQPSHFVCCYSDRQPSQSSGTFPTGHQLCILRQCTWR